MFCDCWAINCSVQLTLALLIWPVWHFLAQQDVGNLCRKGNNQGTIKTKPFLWHWYFKISFTVFINNLLTDQHSSRGIKPYTMIFTVLKFFRKTVPTSQSAVSWEESIPHWTIILYTEDRSSKPMARQSTFSTPPVPKSTAFSETKFFSIQFNIVLALL